MGLQENLAANLRIQRELWLLEPENAHKTTIGAFSEALGLSKNTVKEIFRSDANTTLSTIELIANGLGEPALALLSNDLSEVELNVAFRLLQRLEAFSLLDKERQQEVLGAFRQTVAAIENLLVLLEAKDEEE